MKIQEETGQIQEIAGQAIETPSQSIGCSKEAIASQFEGSLEPFDTKNCLIATKICFEAWATIPAIRIVTILQSRKSIKSVRGISVMIGYSLGSTCEALNLLIEHGYIERKGKNYSLVSGEIVQETEQIVQNTEQNSPKLFRILNDNKKNINKKNNKKRIFDFNNFFNLFPEFPEPQKTEVRKAAERWFEYRSKIKRKPISEYSAKAMIDNFRDEKWTSTDFIQAVKNSISQEWTGLFKPHQKKIKESALDKNIQLVKDLEEKYKNSEPDLDFLKD